MNKIRIYIVLLVVLITVIGCTSSEPPTTAVPSETPTSVPTNTPIPTATATPTVTPIPANPSVMDWHLQFSADTETQLFRCDILQGIDSGVQALIEPIIVRMTAVPVTLQMIEESERIFTQTNSLLSEDTQSLLQDPNMLIMLLHLEIVTVRDIYEPYRIILPSVPNADRSLYSLNEFWFKFNDEFFSDDVLTLYVDDVAYQPISIDEDRIDSGKIYAIYFPLNETNLESVGSLKLTANVQMLVPFRFDSCQSGHYQQFTLQPKIGTGTSWQMPELYGPSGNEVPQELIDQFRLTLLANVLPGYTQVSPTNTPVATQTSEASTDD